MELCLPRHMRFFAFNAPSPAEEEEERSSQNPPLRRERNAHEPKSSSSSSSCFLARGICRETALVAGASCPWRGGKVFVLEKNSTSFRPICVFAE